MALPAVASRSRVTAGHVSVNRHHAVVTSHASASLRYYPAVNSFCRYVALACVALGLAACGLRTPLLPPWCDVAIEPATVDFGQVLPGNSATREIRLVNRGEGECKLT